LEAAEEFGRLDRDARGVVVARVQTVARMSDEMRGSVRARLEEATGKSVELVEEQMPDLIGGVRVLIGSKMYDGSVRRRLDDLTAHLFATRVGAGS
jgi:F0F1-type ATP synthase delta subunit